MLLMVLLKFYLIFVVVSFRRCSSVVNTKNTAPSKSVSRRKFLRRI